MLNVRIIVSGILIALGIISFRNGNMVNNSPLKKFTSGIFVKSQYKNAQSFGPYVLGLIQLVVGIYLLITS